MDVGTTRAAIQLADLVGDAGRGETCLAKLPLLGVCGVDGEEGKEEEEEVRLPPGRGEMGRAIATACSKLCDEG